MTTNYQTKKTVRTQWTLTGRPESVGWMENTRNVKESVITTKCDSFCCLTQKKTDSIWNSLIQLYKTILNGTKKIEQMKEERFKYLSDS